MAQRQTRTEYGCEFEFHDVPIAGPQHRPYWESMSGANKVHVMPPIAGDPAWYVVDVNRKRTQAVTGEQAEDRAFCVAEAITRRDDSALKQKGFPCTKSP